MIKIPYEEIILKINQNTKMEVSEIEERIAEKSKQLSGLISKEGAAHIVANELGVKIFEPLSGKLQIKNILSGMRDVETLGRVLQIYELREFSNEKRSGKVASVVLGDETGSIRVVMWGAQADNVNNLKQDDVVKINGGYVRENNGRKEIHLNERGQLIINPEGETVKGVVAPTNAVIRKNIKDLKENDNDIDLLGTIVQLFDIRFYEVCPSCGKRARPSNDLFNCNDHGNVAPAYAYVLNAVLDDGTETIRTVLFHESISELGLTELEDSEKLTAQKEAILGKEMIFSGNVRNNSFFNTPELIIESVKEINPDEVIGRLEKT